MTKFFYDNEFLEDGKTIELISIGIVAEDGREYYAVSEDTAHGKLNRRIRKHEWLMANVVPMQAEGNHNALADARHNRVKFAFLADRAAGLEVNRP